MGRLAKVAVGVLQGMQCATVAKDQLSVTVFCPHTNETTIYPRSRPLTLPELVAKDAVVYLSDMMGMMSNYYPSFLGPAKVALVDNEVSFGQLYRASLKEMLSTDLLRYATPAQDGPWTGADFFERYLNGSLVQGTVNVASNKKNDVLAEQQQIAAVQDKDNELWNATNWLWSFNNHSQPRGSMVKSAWKKGRAQTCNASLENYIQLSSQQQQQEDSVRHISLCAPAPTGDMSTLCTAMTQFQVDVQQVNCQMMGKGDCISNLGMFYLPYMWSSTNQDFSYNTVSNYYQNILETYFSNESYSNLCMRQGASSVLQSLAKLSAAQNAICPATGLELIKSMLNDLRSAGDDLLLLCYNGIMLVANLIAAVFTVVQGDSQTYLDAAAQYMVQVLTYIQDFMNMIIDMITQLILFFSSTGKIIKTIIIVLCNAYNWWLANVVSYYWCELVRPACIGLFTAIQYVAFMSSDVVSAMQTLLGIIGNGDAQSCRQMYQATAQLKCPSDASSNYNDTQFQPQALASLCWSQAQGGGIYSGMSIVVDYGHYC